jgi:hypothetical protein
MISLVNATRESAEYRNLFRTWRAQILFEQRLALFVDLQNCEGFRTQDFDFPIRQVILKNKRT